MNEGKKVLSGLSLLRAPFPPNQVGKLAKGSKAQMQCPKEEKRDCAVCGGWHHPKLIHLDYVGHAALTDRLLDADPGWTWEPLARREGLPAFDLSGGLWIKLTVCGVTRPGYGNAQESEYKEVGSRDKECIGDALRNAAMRFGAALELWHKGDLHVIDDDDKKEKSPGQIVDENLAMERIETPQARAALKVAAKAIETDFYTLNAKAGVLRWQKEREGMSIEEQKALFECMPSVVRNNLKKCEDAMKAPTTA